MDISLVKKRIAILYICTGKYNRFFERFYISSKENLFVDYEKVFFVWTDDDTIGEGKTDVRLFHKECEGFPADSLFRFEMFLQAEKDLLLFDYIYFFNANAEIRKEIGAELLPDQTGLAMGVWGGRRERQHPMFYPYERNRESLAYIAPNKPPYHYFMGGLNGGTVDAYLSMIRVLANNIREDYKKGIVAKYHDESHINAYLRTHPCRIIPSYLYRPEEFATAGTKVIFREKTHIDSYFNKGRKFTLTAKFKKGMEILWDIVRWYFKF